jgi:hypothetical protein
LLFGIHVCAALQAGCGRFSKGWADFWSYVELISIFFMDVGFFNVFLAVNLNITIDIGCDNQ